MKKIYLIRHGATISNEEDKHQNVVTPLSDMGLKQADLVAERFKLIPIDIIITSDMTRAAETADVISRILNKKVVYTDLFQEILRPKVVRGKRRDDPEVLRIMGEIKKNFANQDWHYSDEENFFDVKRRALRCLKYIESLKEDSILIITHGHFLNMLIGLMGLGDTMRPEQFKLLQKFFIAKNTGITMVDEHNGEYFLMTWNDYVHLGDVDIKYSYL